MRKKLGEMLGQRMRFSAAVERFGSKRAYQGPPLKTILLRDVIRLDTKEPVTDHLWFTCGKSWAEASEGDLVEFDARVSVYEKGYKGWREDVLDAPISRDYRLERPTKVTVRKRSS